MRRRDFLKTTAASATATALAVAGGAGAVCAAGSSTTLGGREPKIAPPIKRWMTAIEWEILSGVKSLSFRDEAGVRGCMVWVPLGNFDSALWEYLSLSVNRDPIGSIPAGCLRFDQYYPFTPRPMADRTTGVFVYREVPWNRVLAHDGRFYTFTDNTGTHRLYPVADFSLIPDAPLTHGA